MHTGTVSLDDVGLDELDTPDRGVMVRVQHGDEEALGLLYARYHRVLYAIALRITGDRSAAEEVLQDTFHAVWRSAWSFQRDGSVRSWLYGIVRNRAIDLTRSRNYHALQREVAEDRTVPSPFLVESLVETAELCTTVRAALAELSPSQRQAIELTYYGGLTSVAIAARLGKPVGTIKTRLRLALTYLQRSLIDNKHD
jgi:RNA polymerase sigma-70 factor, ECF subfamily